MGVEGWYEVQTAQSRTVAAEGEAFLASEGQWLEITHRARVRGGKMAAIWLHARFSLFRTVDLVSLLALPPKCDRTVGAQFREAIDEMLGIHAAAENLTLTQAARRQELGFRMLGLLCGLAPLNAAGEAFLLQSDRLAPVLGYIRSHLKRPIAIDDLAQAAGLSRSRFHRYFQTHLGKTPMEYVKQQRLNEARLMLLGTPQPLYAIAEETGFCNAFHFSREFKKLYGQTPAAYRKLHAALEV